jgi:hypothetical protein
MTDAEVCDQVIEFLQQQTDPVDQEIVLQSLRDAGIGEMQARRAIATLAVNNQIDVSAQHALSLPQE